MVKAWQKTVQIEAAGASAQAISRMLLPIKLLVARPRRSWGMVIRNRKWSFLMVPDVVY